MKSGLYYFKCPKCGFAFSAAIPEVDWKEFDDIRACPCGERMKTVRYVPDEDAISTSEQEGKKK
ncbi:protein of unknown function [Ruminococcaceae bacterium BL-6]|nr:protein of unknown function [Ruminococcaceae bacterium BL-6]